MEVDTAPYAPRPLASSSCSDGSGSPRQSSEHSTEPASSLTSTPLTTYKGDSPPASVTHARAPSNAMKRFEPEVDLQSQATQPSPSKTAVPIRSKAISVSHAIPVVPPQSRLHARAALSINALASKGAPAQSALPAAVPVAQEPNFFTALASQERLVLELKEELKKAEEHLAKLKKQWLSQEALKRKAETRQMHKMRPLAASLASAPVRKDDVDGSSAWMYQEMERRKALLDHRKSTQRRVFNGSRQLKSLSLLAPEKGLLDGEPFSAPADESAMTSNRISTPPLARSYTTPDLAEQIAADQFMQGVHARAQSAMQDESGENFFKSGKQIASDFREGLWTFFEDLRQATVGDEVRDLPSGLPALNSNPNSTKQDLQTRRNARRASSPTVPSKGLNRNSTPLKIETPSSNTSTPTKIPTKTSTIRPKSSVKASEEIGVALTTDNDSELVDVKAIKSEKKKSPTTSKPHKTPQKTALHTRFYSIEEWGTWNTPSSRGTPAPSEPQATPSSQRQSRILPPSYASMPSLTNGPGDEVIYNSTVMNGDHPHQSQIFPDDFNIDMMYAKPPLSANSIYSPMPKHRLSTLNKPSSESLRNSIPKRAALFQESNSSSESLRSTKGGDRRSPASRGTPRSAGVRHTASHMIDEWERSISQAGSPTLMAVEHGFAQPPPHARTPSPRYRV